MKGRIFVVFFLCVGSAVAQFDAGNTIKKVRVRVAFANGGCDASVQVSLTGHSGPTFERSPNDQCEVDFFNVPEGTYHLNVSAQNLGREDLGSINMTSSGPFEFDVQVKPPAPSAPLDRFGVAGNAFVSASDLGVPSRARKEFAKANELISKQDVPHAIERLNKAIALYPSYAVAYNNLGVLYSRLQDPVREREALQKAISLNDHFALAYINLGRMSLGTGDFGDAATALEKASTFDPTDPMALILLSWAEFNQRQFDAAVATAQKAHALPKPHAFVHLLAARSFEQKRQGPEAVAELQLFLQEEPAGPRADAARQELETLKAVLK